MIAKSCDKHYVHTKMPKLLCTFVFTLVLISLTHVCIAELGVILNTWNFQSATAKAWSKLMSGSSPTEAIVEGCNVCEEFYHVCGGSVGYGGSPDENGETALDAMIMDGPTHDVGAVANLRKVKSAIKVAKAVMDHTKETLLVGDLATNFAVEMGFKISNLSTSDSMKLYNNWKKKNCQPNFWQNVSPDPSKHCGPYKPIETDFGKEFHKKRFNSHVDTKHHDTIGMVALDKHGNMAAGTTTNGATFKVPGRVGDSPIMGAGAYVDNDAGAAAATGDGDVMMRFLPSYEVVRLMRDGETPNTACDKALVEIAKFYPKYSGALVALSKNGTIGAACYGFSEFQYSYHSSETSSVKLVTVQCKKNVH